MEKRMEYQKAAPGAIQAMLGLEKYVRSCGLEHSLLELVKTRASQLNGCAFCLDMHSKDALAQGESVQRLIVLDAWREAPFYTGRERAALAWTEAITNVQQGHVPEAVYQQARTQFSETELANLTLAIVTINSWNRFSIAFRPEVGSYQPAAATK